MKARRGSPLDGNVPTKKLEGTAVGIGLRTTPISDRGEKKGGKGFVLDAHTERKRRNGG